MSQKKIIKETKITTTTQNYPVQITEPIVTEYTEERITHPDGTVTVVYHDNRGRVMDDTEVKMLKEKEQRRREGQDIDN